MQPSQTEPTPPGSRWTWAGALVGLVLAVGMFRVTMSARDDPAATPSLPALPIVLGSFMVSGAVVLGGSFTPDGHGGCAGTGARADVVEGAAVVITGAGGSAATGELAVPQALDDGTCRFSFSVSDVPLGPTDYGIMVAGHDVGRKTEQELSGALVTIRLD
ncbi:hypothetical protein [Asanoa sp. NPDC050611]|uniref:hypothetical protein n=1 Tax=Asanoa sp. NPDC050611 TaxID=3157098 RepID=UPI0033C11D73